MIYVKTGLAVYSLSDEVYCFCTSQISGRGDYLCHVNVLTI